MNDPVKIVIEGELVDLNSYIDAERGHRMVAAKLKELYTNFVRYQTLNCKPITLYPVVIQIDWYTKDKKKDPDNVSFAKKFILDAFVINKILVNDGRNQIEGFRDNFYVDKVAPRIEVFIYTVK